MGFISWCQDRVVMMMRTKPQYISVLGRKRSSIRSPQKVTQEKNRGGKLAYSICAVTMFCSIMYGVLLLLGGTSINTSTLIVSLIVAGVASISGGLCLEEYVSAQLQEVPSIYSCCYQYSSEVLAFFIGWTWLISQTAVMAATCKVSAAILNTWAGDTFRKCLESVFFSYSDSVPSVMFVLAFSLFVLTGLSETVLWYIIFVPLAFVSMAAGTILAYVAEAKARTLFSDINLDEIQGIDQILTGSVLCVLFFCGPQSILRISQTRVRQRTAVVLGPLNVVALVISFCLLVVSSWIGKLGISPQPSHPMNLACGVLFMISICVIGIEAFYPLHFVTEDMSSDGLLLRNFSRKWKPFCLPVASCLVQMITAAMVGLLSIFLPLFKLLNLCVLFPLMVNTIVPILVLLQRYKDNSTWQYEPMFHTVAKNLNDKSREKSQEYQYTNGSAEYDVSEDVEISTTCIDENPSDASSDTDVDSVVQQYQDQTKVATTPVLDNGDSDDFQEPTPTSSLRAKFCTAGLFSISLIISITLNLADAEDHFSVIVVVLMCMLFSTVIQGLLLCLPQNQPETSNRFCSKVPNMPWVPGIASLFSSCLLFHCLLQIWQVCLSWHFLGLLIYFTYGIRSSTAANSFYNLQPTNITLRPLPSYGNNCIPQVIPPQRKISKTRRGRKAKKGLI